MEEFKRLLQEVLTEELIQINLSNSRDVDVASKARVRPVVIGKELLFQETLYRGTQVFHANYTKAEMAERLTEQVTDLFKQIQIQSTDLQATVLVSKKGKLTLKRKNLTAAEQSAGKKETAFKNIKENQNRERLSHNRTKQYILQEGKPVDFLVGLGVQTPDGRITKARYDKFRQINRYLEFIEDVLDKLPNDRTLRVIDFGCGKSYLTFAMYYYLHEMQGRDIRVTGLDLKEDVIKHCNELAEQLNYTGLHFEHGDIGQYTGADEVDMVVTLHACDTATDHAIAKAISWRASVIMVVPCCQHEVNKQIKNELMAPVLRYGLIKERMSALMTDALRANLMEQMGYETQVLEFIDMEHTPKNLLIRGVKQSGMRGRKKPVSIQELNDAFHLDLTLEKLLKDNRE